MKDIAIEVGPIGKYHREVLLKHGLNDQIIEEINKLVLYNPSSLCNVLRGKILNSENKIDINSEYEIDEIGLKSCGYISNLLKSVSFEITSVIPNTSKVWPENIQSVLVMFPSRVTWEDN